jgi:hypothetical protein
MGPRWYGPKKVMTSKSPKIPNLSLNHRESRVSAGSSRATLNLTCGIDQGTVDDQKPQVFFSVGILFFVLPGRTSKKDSLLKIEFKISM